MSILFYFFLAIFLLFSLFTCFIILIQESKSLGLGASFGGDAGDSLFGASTAAVLKRFTTYLVILFMVGCVCLSFWTNHLGRKETFFPAADEKIIEEE